MITDSLGRQLRYLRVSVTDRCNLRCAYCMPQSGIELLPADELLSYEEIARLVGVAVSLGVDTVRLTGGEPLVRKDLPHLIRRLRALPGLADLSLTTNGTLLAAQAPLLKEAGLQRVNISLDSLDPARYQRLTCGGDLADVLAGIDAALAAGLGPVKLNAVLFADGSASPSPEEILAFGRLTLARPMHVRFIEWMAGCSPLSLQGDDAFPPTSADRIQQLLLQLGELAPDPGPPGSGPAHYFRYPGAPGTLGFITPLSVPFCPACSRLRLTSDGKLRLCLLHQAALDLRTPLRAGVSDAELATLFRQAALLKPAAYPSSPVGQTSMYRIGG